MRFAVALLCSIGMTVSPSDAQEADRARWELVQEGTITRMSDGPPGRAWDLARDSAGRTYVAGVQGIHVFSEAGQPLGAIGSRGVPGSEDFGIYGIANTIGLRDGEIWAADGSRGRIHWFALDGTPLERWTEVSSAPSMGRGMRLRPVGALGSRRAVFVEWPEDLDMLPTLDGPVRLFVTNLGGKIVGQIGTVDARTATLVATDEGGFTYHRRQPFTFCDFIAIDPYTQKFAVLRRPVPQEPDSAHYSLTVYGSDGTEAWTTRRPYRPVRLTDEAFNRWIDSAGAGASQAFDRPAEVFEEVYERHLFRPEFLPPVPNDVPGIIRAPIAFGREGSVWVERRRPADATVWDVFDREGKRIGTARGPDDLDLMVVDGDTALGIRHDDRDGEYRQSVVRLSVREMS
jgi:hypothetical protein